MLNTKTYKNARSASLVIIIYQSLTKGWASFGMVPLLVVVIPVMILFSKLSIDNTEAFKSSKFKIFIAWLIIILPTLAYTTAVGFGDTNEVFLFGFLPSTQSSLITDISQFIYTVCITLYLPLHIFALVYYLLSSKDS